MQALIDVILPVFLVLGAGYLAVSRGYFSAESTDGLTKFSQNFAIPCLLFSALARLDLAASFDPALLVAFYSGALSGFGLGALGARFLFNRPWEDSIAIGFCGLFSNSVLLGLPITERAYGADALAANFAIIAVHAPICYGVGILAMELVKARGDSLRHVPARLIRAMFRNALIIGIGLGLAVNLSGVTLPNALWSAVDLMVQAALPAAIFALGGVLVRYRPEGDLRVVGMICAVSLIAHPAITFVLSKALALDTAEIRSAVLTASMPPGVNTFLFASLYGVALRVAATGVLIATALSIFTIWTWLQVVP